MIKKLQALLSPQEVQRLTKPLLLCLNNFQALTHSGFRAFLRSLLDQFFEIFLALQQRLISTSQTQLMKDYSRLKLEYLKLQKQQQMLIRSFQKQPAVSVKSSQELVNKLDVIHLQVQITRLQEQLEVLRTLLKLNKEKLLNSNSQLNKALEQVSYHMKAREDMELKLNKLVIEDQAYEQTLNVMQERIWMLGEELRMQKINKAKQKNLCSLLLQINRNISQELKAIKQKSNLVKLPILHHSQSFNNFRRSEKIHLPIARKVTWLERPILKYSQPFYYREQDATGVVQQDSLRLGYPSIKVFFEEQAVNDDQSNLKNYIDCSFLIKMRAILDAKANQLFVNKSRSSRFADFTYAWFNLFHVNQNCQIVRRSVQNNEAGQFYRELNQDRFSKLWEVLTFKEFINQIAVPDQIQFFLRAKLILFEGDILGYSKNKYQPIIYLPIEKALTFLVRVMKGYEAQAIRVASRVVASQTTGKGGLRLVDAFFVLRVVLEYYRVQRLDRFRAINLIFKKVAKNREKGISFPEFLKLFDHRFTDATLLQKCALYRQANLFGGGKVTTESFFVSASENGFFCRFMSLHNVSDISKYNKRGQFYEFNPPYPELYKLRRLIATFNKQPFLQSLGIFEPVFQIGHVEGMEGVVEVLSFMFGVACLLKIKDSFKGSIDLDFINNAFDLIERELQNHKEIIALTSRSELSQKRKIVSKLEHFFLDKLGERAAIRRLLDLNKQMIEQLLQNGISISQLLARFDKLQK